MKIGRIAIMVGIASMAYVASSWGADFPAKPVRILMGSSPGSATAVMLRFMAPAVEKVLGQPVVVESKVGGAGVLALELMKSSKPDGYTIAGTPDAPLTGIPHMREVAYNPQRDFASIIMYALQEGAVAVRSDSPFKKFQDLTEYARKNPGLLTVGISDAGNNVHLGAIQIDNHDKIKVQYVPFQGSAPAATAAMGGHVMAVSCSAGTLVPHIKAGTLRVLLVLGKKRMADAPDAPTADELGYPPAVTDIVSVKCILTVPKAVPRVVKDRLIAAFSEGVRSPEYRNLALQNGVTIPDPLLVGEALDKYLYGISELSGKAIRQIGLQKK